MDASLPTELPAFLDFCKSLDAAVVHTPEQAVELYRTHGPTGSDAPAVSDLGRDLRRLREQIVAGGAPLLDEAELDLELAERRGQRLGQTLSAE